MPKGGHYAIFKGLGGFSGVVGTWSECSKLVNGVSGAKFKKFATLAEAQAFARGEIGYGASKKRARSRSSSSGVSKKKRTVEIAANCATKGASKTYLSDDEELEAAISSKFDELAKADVKSTPPAAKIVVYTDGACEHNGTPRAKAGVGVYFGPGDSRNISEPLPGALQTNQRAEMLAVIRALEVMNGRKDNAPLVIKSDSNYTVKGHREWLPNWKRNGWKTSTKSDVKNSDLWRRLDSEMIKARARRDVLLQWVRGHAGEIGNEAADRLAVAGITKPPR
mmetsp:Transcript_24291/g.45452  ORF Transcript_24291/g.45452 Transcript_24291/m.45452 type:complete len:280 (-) Transcript_24291:212-1051(-)